MTNEDRFERAAKQFAATYCVTLNEKQYNTFVVALALLLRQIYKAGSMGARL